MTNVTRPCRSVDRVDGCAEFVAKAARQLVERDPLAAGDVVDTTADAIGFEGCDVRVDDVVDVREVARLLAVAEDHGRLAMTIGPDEPWDHRRVFGLRILPRTEDVEVAKRHGLKAVDIEKAAA